MSLAPGAKLGPYEVVAPIGAGGMGEVFRALDTRLDRTVAIKVLPADLAGDAQFRERFDREARAISSLQHPHICTLFDVGHQDGIDFLVLEFIDGETLAARLARSGALSVPDALRCAIEICDALDRAHRSGIVHRDLKPANVMLTKSGVKLLDFGLAKVAAPAVTTSTVSILPTTPAHVTAQGTILGTFQYMAPEQIEGLEADARTDIFAFGALLYETMTARKAFEGKTRASLLGAILKDEAPRPSAVQPLSSPALDRVVTTCLAKDPDDRYQSARDLLRELKWIASGAPEAAVRDAAPAPRRTPWIPWSIAAAALLAFAAAGTLALRHVREVAVTPAAVQFTIAPPAEVTFATPPAGGSGLAPQLAISPDERHLVFVGSGKNGYQLWLRPIAALDATAIPGTEGAAFPFWSADSRFIGFFADNKLKKVNVGGGPPTPLCAAVAGRGGTWNRDNVIIFALTGGGPLQRVSASGGAPQPVSTIDAAWGETSHRFPWFLPDGRHFLYTGTSGTCCPPPKPGRLRLGSLDSPDAITLQQVDSSGIFASEHLLYVLADGTLMAQPFDASTLKASGDPFPIAERVSNEGSRYSSFSASPTGLLVYAHGAARPTTQLTWMDRGGKVLGTVGPPDSYFGMSLSGDEQHVAVSLSTGTPPNRDIWVLDTARGIRSRLTFEPTDDNYPIWSPDDSQLVFSGNRDRMIGSSVLLRQNVNGTTKEEILKTPGAVNPSPTDWSADGQYILFSRGSATTVPPDVWALPLRGNQQPFAVLQTPFPENNTVLAPGGRWLAYVSSETGSPEVFVQPFPTTGGKFQISRAGGGLPLWRRDGKELFFVSGDGQLMAAPTDITNQFIFGEPMALFAVRSPSGLGATARQYAPSKDGRRFLVNAVQQAGVAIPLNVVISWPSTIAR